jgi:surface antigen
MALTSLDSQATSYALRGLKERGRVVLNGKGPAATWALAHRKQAAA